MAKAKAAPAAKATVPNLFKKAAEVKTNVKKKTPPGTVITLPQTLETVDGKSQLTKDAARLNDAITRLIEAKADENAALNKKKRASSDLLPFVEANYAELVARGGMLPATPIQILNLLNEDVTYVIADRTGSTGLSDEQIEMLEALIGPEKVSQFIIPKDKYAFDEAVMDQIAGEIPEGASAEVVSALPKVRDVVFEIVSAVLVDEVRLTDEQKGGLIACTTKKLCVEGTVDRVVDYTGRDPSRVEQFLTILGSALTRYFKV